MIMGTSPIQKVDSNFVGNNLYIKRDDLIPYSFGGNKARKANLFFKLIDAGRYDTVVTYGSSHSNHCRVVANLAAARNMLCHIIAPSEVSEITFNRRMMQLFGAKFTSVPITQVHGVIENKIQELKNEGKKVFFIPGGGHGNIGTRAYIGCYNEIKFYEEEKDVHFEYIFFASGTGTTQAGLVCGQIMNSDDRKIIGISIARENPRGRNVVIESIEEFFSESNIHILENIIQENTFFLDDYVNNGYGKRSKQISDMIKLVLRNYGIPLDVTYTGKAFWGMKDFIEKWNIRDKTILFIHTGGTPLFFDELMKCELGD